MRVVAIIQARMGSTRLPGKILKNIMDKPLLHYQIERLNKCEFLDDILVATTDKKIEEPIINLCEMLKINIFRGSEQNVLSRYYDAAKCYKADVIVRLTSDCPLIDPKVVDKVIKEFLKSNVDYASNTLIRTYPRGMDVEVFSMSTLEIAFIDAIEQFEREHVTPYIYMNRSLFKTLNVEYDSDESIHRWTVDTEEDFLLIEKILNNLYPSNKNFSMEDVLSLIKQNPLWKEINGHIEQKKLRN